MSALKNANSRNESFVMRAGQSSFYAKIILCPENHLSYVLMKVVLYVNEENVDLIADADNS